MKCVRLLVFLYVLLLPYQLLGEKGSFWWAFGDVFPGNSFNQFDKYDLTKEQLGHDLIFYFRPGSNSYMYLFSVSMDCKFKLIFPKNFDDLRKTDYSLTPYFKFDESDICPLKVSKIRAQIHMLVSTKPLEDFERLIDKYRKATDSEKKAWFSDILMYIFNLKSRRFMTGSDSPPWDHSHPFSPNTDIVDEVKIETEAVEFKYYFEVFFRYECE